MVWLGEEEDEFTTKDMLHFWLFLRSKELSIHLTRKTKQVSAFEKVPFMLVFSTQIGGGINDEY